MKRALGRGFGALLTFLGALGLAGYVAVFCLVLARGTR